MLCSGYDEVRGGDEHDDGGHHGVHTQPDQAEPVNHHRRELPVGDHNLLLILLSHSLCQESENDIQIRIIEVIACNFADLSSLRMSLTSWARFMLTLKARLVAGQQ